MAREGDLSHLSVGRLQTLSALVVDSSSLILSNRVGFLIPLARELSLRAPRAVIEEVKDRVMEGAGLAAVAVLDAAGREALTADQEVVDAAVSSGLPVLSDDLALLGRAAARGVEGYTARVMLELLLLRGGIDLATYATHKRELESIIRYTMPLFVAAEELHWQVRKTTGLA